MNEQTCIERVLDCAAEDQPDFQQRLYDRFYQLAPSAEALMTHIDEEVQGKMLAEVIRLFLSPDVAVTDQQYLLFETSNPRHAHEWQIFQERKNDIPENKILVPGCLDSTTNFVEHPMLVAERINKFVSIVGHDRVIGGTDCGFGTFAGFGAVDPDIAYAKLKSLAEGASLVK